jgi:PPOX class probable F420-dependent enzyme
MVTNNLGNERYVSLESYKRDGNGVKTPVWVAELDGKLVVVTDGTSYKVKRIRRNPKIRLAPCSQRGRVRGPWVDGAARVIEDMAHAARAHEALTRKYGWQLWLFDTIAKIGRRFQRRIFLEISV